VRPSAADGYLAASTAASGSGSRELGAVGAGAGATVGKWRGAELAVDAGLVGAVLRDGPLVVACLVAVNAWGDVVGVGRWAEPEPVIAPAGTSGASEAFANTTIGVVATNAALDKVGLQHVARGAHDGLARAVNPPHASVDGDAFVALGTGTQDAPLDRVRWMAVKAVEQAITGGMAD
jgi:L-aminopeptidase/D-esterase-like protein